MPNTLIHAQHLHRYYTDTHAVNDVTIKLQQGDILGLLGPNGAGKSSCMQMLCGVLAPSAGKIEINGVDLLDHPNLAKQHIGYLPDKPPLYTDLTVDEYLTYAARLRRTAKNNLHDYLEQAKQRCGLSTHGKRLIGNLSKGYQQRVGIAQAIIHEPDVIILDEPTVGLDPIQMREIRNLITELGKHHGIILSTHILPEVQAVCTHVQIIQHGRSVFSKSMREIQSKKQISLRLEKNITTEELLNIPSIESAIQISPAEYLLSGNKIENALASISEYCVTQKWGLLEISPRENNLEQTFIQLIARETSANSHMDAA